MGHLLEIKDLSVAFGTGKESVQIIEDLNFTLDKGETLGIVGESGSGKSVTSLAVMRLLPAQTSKVTGKVLFDGTNLLQLGARDMQQVRGNQMAMIFQEPMTSLNPIQTCGQQIMEPLFLHSSLSKKEAKERALELLRLCGIPDEEQRFHEYPHQMSGGMRQRVMIAIALACNPRLLIADEPTTALDVTIQAQILDLMKDIKRKTDMSVIMITHDLGIVADFCDRVLIFYCGQIVEGGTVKEIFEDPKHPYTRGLLKAIPRVEEETDRLQAIEGMVPDADDMPKGCRFHPRCPHAFDLCREAPPCLQALEGGRQVRCHLYNNPKEPEQ